MVDVVNLWPDPKLQTTAGTTVLAENFFQNPSPTSALTNFTADGTATVTLDAGSSIKGPGGVKVISPDTSSGLRITAFPGWTPNYEHVGFFVYVRAHAAMTVTASIDADYVLWDPVAGDLGWGDYGWGETFSFVAGASHTFAAGEVKRFRGYARVKRSTSGGTWISGTSGEVGYKLHLKGTGTFDVDAVYQNAGVRESADPLAGGVGIPTAPLWFDGSTADDATFTYEWTGTPEASTSRKLGLQTKYLRAPHAGVTAGHEPTYTMALTGGEKAGVLQSGWTKAATSYASFTSTGDPAAEDLKPLGLEVGKSYVLSYDFVTLHENYLEGSVSGGWDSFYGLAGADGYIGYPMEYPQRQRINLPFTVDSSALEAYAQVYRNYETGATALTSVSLFEVAFHMPQWSSPAFGQPGYGVAGTLDLLAQGAVAGGSYNANTDRRLNAAGQYYRFEYQTGGGGSWTTLAESVYDAGYVSDSYAWEFTVPADATALRLAHNNNGTFRLDLYSTPPEFFYGDTPDGGGYTYSWSGTPYDSSSIRSEASTGPTAQVFTGGVAKNVSEMRVVVGGSLVPVTQAGG